MSFPFLRKTAYYVQADKVLVLEVLFFTFELGDPETRQLIIRKTKVKASTMRLKVATVKVPSENKVTI